MNTASAVSIRIRWMIRRDMSEVYDIERLSFECAWSEEDFLRCLRQHNCIGMVAEHDEKVVGFVIYELHKNKLHILNFAVHPSHRRVGSCRWRTLGRTGTARGVGSALVDKLSAKLSEHGRTHLTLEVRETNLVAQLFFRRCGFLAVNTARQFYEDTDEDAILMEYRL